MHANSRFSSALILGLIMLTLFGCSETTKQADPLPELTSIAHFPYVQGDSIYTFNPELGTSDVLANSDTGLIIALDTDVSKSEKIDNENNVEIEVFTHTATAEYIAYANKQTLHLIDLNTRYDHEIFSFKEDKKFDPVSQTLVDAEESYICDIQKSIVLDEETRLEKKILYKDELKLYVKTSLQEDCTESEEAPFSYWQINIEESSATYTRRRTILKEHTHKHTHVHDHSDSDHDHEHSDELIQQDKADLNNNLLINHEHEHESHTHDFVYGPDHFHDFLTKSEVDAVHNAPIDKEIKTYQEIQFETHPILKGQKTTIESIDEALMYSGMPVVDIRNRNFGYIGLNSSTNTYKFYSIDLDTFKKSFLWELSNENFTNTNKSILTLSDLEKMTPRYNRLSNFQYVGEDILVLSNNQLIYFTLTELFDDDESETRELSVSNPAFISLLDDPPLEERMKYNAQSKRAAIIENMDVWEIEFAEEGQSTKTLIKRYNEPNLITLSASFIGDELFVEKIFEDAGIIETSMTSLHTSGLEDQTLIQRTVDKIITQKLDTDILITRSDNFSQILSTTHFGPDFNNPFFTDLDNSLWTLNSTDYRGYTEKNIITFLRSDDNPDLANSIEAPKLFILDKIIDITVEDDDDNSSDNEFPEGFNGVGEDFGFVRQAITGASKVVIFSDLYGFIEVQNIDETSSTYFFSNEKSSFNFDNEFKEMKLLDPSNTTETSE